MMDELRDLYQEVILDHSRSPRNFGRPAGANRSAEGYNPLCGDQLTVHLRVEGDRLCEAAFEGTGCAISRASASLMTAAVKGRTAREVEELFDRFHGMVASGIETEPAKLGKLVVFAGVRAFPMRVKCASLPWHTLRAALRGETDSVSTE